MRFRDLADLRKHISPDVVIVDADAPTEAKKRVVQAHSQQSVLEDRFAANWRHLGGPAVVREHRFHPTRKWRLDFALPEVKLGFEIMGGLYQAQSGHRSQAGVKRDYEKANAAQELGWTLYNLTSQDIDNAAYLEKLIDQARRLLEEARHAT